MLVYVVLTYDELKCQQCISGEKKQKNLKSFQNKKKIQFTLLCITFGKVSGFFPISVRKAKNSAVPSRSDWNCNASLNQKIVKMNFIGRIEHKRN